MNTEMLLALGLALGVAVVVVAWLLRRGPGAASRPAAAAARPSQTVHSAQTQAQAPSAGAGAAQIDAQRQLATEALRLARQRKADDAMRLDAERASHARAEALARAAVRPPALPAQPAPPVAAAAPTAPTARPLPPLAAQPPRPVAAPVAAPVLPAAPALRSPLVISPATPAAPAAAPAAAPGLAPLRSTPTPRQPLVLLADDSKVVRIKTGRLLEKQGWQVVLADDGAAALQALDTHAPDLLITDVEMPGLDGFELTRQVRAHPRFARLPVIMITSSDERHRAEALAAGVNLLLGKPYAEETLLAQVQVLLATAAQRSGTSLALH